MNKLTETLTSRKLWMTISACAAVVGTEGWKAGLWKIVALVATYVVAQGSVDVAAKINPPS